MSRSIKKFSESDRIENLMEFSILDTLPEEEYDNITYLASYICKTPISLVTLVDDKRQWFKSKIGVEVNETSRDISFCGHAIENEDIFIVPDSRKDAKFSENPLVTQEPNVVFYAGVPLVSNEGFPLGTLCVIDSKPRSLDESQIKALRSLASQVTALFEKRRQSFEIQKINNELKGKNEILKNFAHIVAHDIKTPLTTIALNSELINEKFSSKIGEQGIKMINRINSSAYHLSNLVDGILEYSKNSSLIENKRERFNIVQLVQDVVKVLSTVGDIECKIDSEGEKFIFFNKVAFEQILMNVLSNSLKYNDKEKTKINVQIRNTAACFTIVMSDNGPGVPKSDFEKIFGMFYTVGHHDKYGKQGTGIGLATVKHLTDALGGVIEVNSVNGLQIGLTFSLSDD